MKIGGIVDWNTYWLLFIIGQLTLIAALPYSVSLTGDAIYDFGGSLPMVLATQFAQATVIFLISIFTGLYLGKKVGLGAPVLGHMFKYSNLPPGFLSFMKLSLFLGFLLSTVVFVLDVFIFSLYVKPLILYLITPPLWERVLYSLYAGFIEEIILRFFLMTTFVWISWKIKRKADNSPTDTGVWLSIISVGLIYSFGYLISPISADKEMLNISIVMLYNTSSSIIFGWLYWKKGIEASIIANLSASIMIFVILGSLLL